MSRLKVPYGTTAQLTTAVVQEREVVFDTTLDRLAYGDGSAAAGVPVAKLSEVQTLPTGSDASAAEVTATGSTEGRSLADRFADCVNVLDYGAVMDGVTSDRAALSNAAVAAAGKKLMVIPAGSAASLYLPSSLAVSCPVFLMGPELVSQNLFSSEIIAGFSDKNWFNRADRGSSSYSSTPTTYTVIDDLAGVYQIFNNAAGYQQNITTDSGGRTMVPANYVVATHSGYGDLNGWFGAISVSKHAQGDSVSGSWTGRNSATIVGGHTGAATDKVNVYAMEYVLDDNNFDDVAALGLIISFSRQGTQTVGYRTPWLGVRLQQSDATETCDAAYQMAGLWRVGLDCTPATFDSAKAAVAIKQGDRIYTRAEASTAATNWFAGDANSLGAAWVEDDGVSITHVLDDATNTGISRPIKARHSTTGTPGAGIGVGMAFEVETAAGNLEVGAAIDVVSTDVTSTSEDFDVVVKAMSGGAAASEVARFKSNGAMQIANGKTVPYVLAQGHVGYAHTGNTNETALATISIPAGAIGPNGFARVTTLWKYTNSGNTKTLRVRLGGVSGTVFFGLGVTTTNALQNIQIIRNRGAANSQVSMTNSISGVFGTSAADPSTGAVDTASAQDLVISGQLANSGETITLESYIVEICYGA